MDEQVGVDGGLEDRARRPGVAREDDPPPAPRLAEHVGGPHDRAVGERHVLPALERAEERARRDAEPRRSLDVEAARPLLLDERVADRRGAVVDLNRLDRVVAALDPLAGAELDEPVRVRELAEDPRERAEEVLEPARAVDGQRRLAPAERERLHQAGQPERVVGVEVREEDLVHVHEPDRRTQELALRPLAAVEKQSLAAAAQEQSPRARVARSVPSRTCRGRRDRDPRGKSRPALRLGIRAAGARCRARATSSRARSRP